MIGVDLSERMVEWARAQASREGLESRVEFRVADAQNLLFEDDRFDAVISESVLVFVPDREKAIHEYLRVSKPGGYISLNESTWLKTPVPEDVVRFLSQTFVGARLEAVGTVEAGNKGRGERAFQLILAGCSEKRIIPVGKE